MVDENESQQVVTPELITENIEAGINFLDPLIREAVTLEEYRSVVRRITTQEKDCVYIFKVVTLP